VERVKLLETIDLSVEFEGFKALSDLNFSLEEGELRVIIGPNGAGKTTFLDLITGKTKPTKGKIILKGKEITGLNPSIIAALGVGRKFQGPNLFANLSVQENIEVGLKGGSRVSQSLFFRKTKEVDDKINEILALIGLYERKNEPAEVLSHGEKQWLEMGMLLAQDPQLIILDEPTTGMTAAETYKTGELVQSIFKGRSMIIIEHDMAFVRQVAQKVTVFHQGMVLAEGTWEDIERNQDVQAVYLKEAHHA
jgi:urea transport system ATP-binding protein